jgi:membrane-associated phospholipid phosphatase
MNNSIFYFLYNFAHQSNFLDKFIIFCAVYLPYLVTLGVFIFILLHHKSWMEVTRVFVAGVVAWVAAALLKIMIHTPRPFDAISTVHSLFPETGYAFPSGHATFFAGLAFAVYFKHKKAGYVFLACALIIGLARVAGGVHFPIDILGGFILGALVANFAKTL